MTALLLCLVLLTAVGKAVPTLPEKHITCNTYVISGIPGGFTTRNLANFSSANAGGDAATLISSYGYSISNYPINDTPIPRVFTPSNVNLGTGTLDLKVSAYTGTGSIQAGEVVTNAASLYSSVRVVVKSSTTPGVVEGFFYYLNDNQEIDWEILTTTALTSSPDVPAGIWATNQATTPGGNPTDAVIPFSFDPSAAFHEYRIDWVSGSTTFYIDGVQQTRFTTNVPTSATYFIANAWSNGDPEWSNGPPTSDSITHVRSIDLYTGYTTTASGATCSI